MTDPIIEVADGFWNIRGSFRIAGVLDVGTQSSLVRLSSGAFVLLDSLTFPPAVERRVAELTDGGEAIEAVLNLHPFHTVHVEKTHQTYPRAKLYGTPRHREKFPGLPWEEEGTQEKALHRRYAKDLQFSVPNGVDFISDDENVHFASVLAYHPASKTIHSDDTLNYLRLPAVARAVGLGDSVGFHPTLAKALQKRAGAAREFSEWAAAMIAAWAEAENLCAAHTAALLARNNDGAPLHERLQAALDKVRGTLEAHESRYG